LFSLAFASHATAKPQHGGASAIISGQGVGFTEAAGDAPDALLTAGLDLRGGLALGSFPIGFAAGAGYRFGASVPGGFAYEFGVMPVGLGVFFDGIGWLAVTAGGDLSGVTARVPFAPRAVAEGRVELQLPGPFHFSAFIRPAWLAVDARESGSEYLDFADEFEAGLGFRIGSEQTKWGIDTSRGLFVGGVVRQWLGTTGYGLMLGYTVDGQFGG
jgi:hypothetical protein